jgi:hypothetical protein
MRRRGLVALALFVPLALAVAAVAGARSEMFKKPTTYRTPAHAACGTWMFFSGGSPGRRIPAPGRPGLSARATSKRSAVVTWRISRFAPAKCRTIALLVSLGTYAHWLPITREVQTRGRYTGTVRLSVPSTAPPSDTVIATALGAKYRGRSGVAGVLIRR